MKIFNLLALFIIGLFLSACRDVNTAERATQEDILIIGNNAEPQSLDPHKATSVSDGRIISSMLEGLVRPDPKDTSLMLPAVAERWESNASATEWIFYLRKNAKWSDGRPVKASDFCYSYQRLLHPEFAGKYASMLYPIKGAESYNRGKSPWETVGVEALDAHRLKITLEGATPQLLQLMLHFTWFPVPAHIIEAEGGMLDRRSPWTRVGKWVGNGAYKLKEHRFNHYLEVEASPTYWRKDEVKNKGIRFMPIVNGYTETRMFFDDKLHITNNVPPEMISFAKRKGGASYTQTPYYCTIFYRLNTNRPPLNDPRIREALSLAIDREMLVEKIVRGAGEAASSFTPPSRNFKLQPHDLPLRQQAPTQLERSKLARDLLAEAGFPEGKDFPILELMTTSREAQRIMAECIQAFWLEELGIRVEIRVNEWTAYKVAQQAGDYDISSSAWSGDYLDPASFVELWRSGGGNNSTGWGNADFDAALRDAQQSSSPEQRLKALLRAERIMLSAQPVIPLYWSHRCYLVRPEVKGFHPSLLETQPLDAVRLEACSN